MKNNKVITISATTEDGEVLDIIYLNLPKHITEIELAAKNMDERGHCLEVYGHALTIGDGK